MQRNDHIYAIPSYNRVTRQATVNYLHSIGVPRDRIVVYVQTEGDFKAYTDMIGDISVVKYAPAKRGVEARNNILRGEAASDIVMLDDDVRAIGMFTGAEVRKIEDVDQMDGVFEKCFATCRKADASFFGVYPVYNDFYMERTISTKAPVNTVFGFPSGITLRYNEEYDTKEDAELCARVLRRGGRILRFNFLAVDADHRKTKDGYIDDWHQEENMRCVRRLALEYPDVYKPQTRKPWEVRCLIKDKKIKIGGDRYDH